MQRPCKYDVIAMLISTDKQCMPENGCCIFRIFDAGRKGQGLQAAEDIVQGTLVTEYVGKQL